MQKVLDSLQLALAQVLASLHSDSCDKAQLESPKQADHGDLACTAAMPLAKALKQPPRQIAQIVLEGLQQTMAFQTWVDTLAVAGPGFINIRLKLVALHSIVRDILHSGERYGCVPVDTAKRVIVEFVSANPTGPLHVGHGRQAALGDAICHLLHTQGWQVHREFYYNDAGVQIQKLAASLYARVHGWAPGDANWPEGGYAGEYIVDIAQAFIAKATVVADDRQTTATGDAHDLAGMRDFAVAWLRHEQDLDLQAFHLRFDRYYLESSLYRDGRVAAAVARLQEQGKTYEQDGALWLRTTAAGDDKDRVMRKASGEYTYFVPDLAYHQSKWERGFQKAVNIQGSDHHGTIARIRAGLQFLDIGIPAGYPDYVLHTMVRVMRAGAEVKISKRAGAYVTLRDVIDWTSRDAVRFFLLSRKPDTEFIFDIDLARSKNNENPVYYVQYAHARICSILRNWGGDAADLAHANLAPLTSAAARSFMLLLSRYPAMLRAAARDLAVHDVVFYLRETAAAFHSYYEAEKILEQDETTRLARVALVAAAAQVLRSGLAILGVSAPSTM